MQFHRFRQLAVLAGALLLAGCVAEGGPDYGPPIRPGPSQPQMCPMIYAPVCATRGSSRKTFGNSCQA
ncbi:MAG TPA: protease inhibitor, partial [Ochrobactrum anthropi]|nr:protease inhibitor [Brucella anthropi]